MRAVNARGAAAVAVLSLLLVVTVPVEVAQAETPAAAAATSPNITAVTRTQGDAGRNATGSMHFLGVSLDASVLRRAAYFCLGVVAVLGFFAALRMRKRFRKPRKYGVIVTPADEVEMDPLADDLGDEDEDTTLFEAKRQR